MTDHAGLAADVAGRFGPLLGRARQLGIWTLAFVAAMTLPGAVRAALAGGALAGGGFRRTMRIIAWPRYAAGAVSRPRARATELRTARALRAGAGRVAAAAGRHPGAAARAGQFRAATAAAAAAFSIAVWLMATVGRDRIWAGAESMGAVTRLDGEDRELARCLRAQRRAHEPVMIEPLAFAEIGVAHAAGVPWTESMTLIVTREPRATAAESMAATGARFLAGYDRPTAAGRAGCPTGPHPTRKSVDGESSPETKREPMWSMWRCRLRGAPESRNKKGNYIVARKRSRTV